MDEKTAKEREAVQKNVSKINLLQKKIWWI